jgi:hypothetical protein
MNERASEVSLTYVVYLLVGNSAIVLKHVVVNGARGSRDLLEDGLPRIPISLAVYLTPPWGD